MQNRKLYFDLSKKFYNKIKKELSKKGFVISYRETQTIRTNHQGKEYKSTYYLTKFRDKNQRFLSWFELNSDIEHVSNIVAIIGVGSFNKGEPIYAMNLNFKEHLNTYNVILGFRSNYKTSNRFDSQISLFKNCSESPFYIQDNPKNFQGVRYAYWVNQIIIKQSFVEARRLFSTWMDECEHNDDDQEYEYNIIYKEYKEYLLNLHSPIYNVYNALFGDNWLFKLFQNKILNKNI